MPFGAGQRHAQGDWGGFIPYPDHTLALSANVTREATGAAEFRAQISLSVLFVFPQRLVKTSPAMTAVPASWVVFEGALQVLQRGGHITLRGSPDPPLRPIVSPQAPAPLAPVSGLGKFSSLTSPLGAVWIARVGPERQSCPAVGP